MHVTDVHLKVGWISNEIPQSSLFVPARYFNQVECRDQLVRKTSQEPSIVGEAFFYKNMPSDIASLFPSLIDTEVVDTVGELRLN